MAHTFTGLKLHGAIGKFGLTEISDIEGFIELPDGRVLSSCEWGSMLHWEGGLIKVEIARKNRKRCHVGPFQQLVIDEGELMTVGVDGNIRVWDLEAIDNAEATDESGVFELEPMNELRVAPGVALKSIIKCELADEVVVWYAQDASGGIWKLDLSFSHTSQAPEKLASLHSGAIASCDVSPVAPFVASIAQDGRVRLAGGARAVQQDGRRRHGAAVGAARGGGAVS